MWTRHWFVICVVILFAANGCISSDDSGGGGAFNSGIEGSKTIDALTDSELQDVCDSSADYVRSFVASGDYEEFACRTIAIVQAVQTGGDQMMSTCTSTYDQCRQDFMATVKSPTNCVKPSGCTATLDDLQQCLTDQASSFGSLDVPSCAEADFSEQGLTDLMSQLEMGDPDSCVTLESECPEVTDLINPDVQASGIPGA